MTIKEELARQKRYNELYDQALYRYLDRNDINIMDYVEELLSEEEAKELIRLDKEMQEL